MSETEWITIRTKEAPKEWLEQRRKSIWLPNGNEKQLEQIRRVFRVEVGILYINGRRVRTPRDGEKCKVCGSYNGLYGGFCQEP